MDSAHSNVYVLRVFTKGVYAIDRLIQGAYV